MIGPTYSEQATICAVTSGIYDRMILSPTASLSGLSSKTLYPLFGRSVPPDTQQSSAMLDFLRYYYNITAEPKWLNCSIISTADSYGVDGSRQFIAAGVATTPNVTVLAFQQFLVGATDISVEVGELNQSGTRVFVAYMASHSFQTVLLEANKQKLIGDYFVWLCSDGCSTDSIHEDANGKVVKKYQQLSRGLTGFLPQGGTGIRYQEYLDRWLSLDPDVYPGAGSIPTIQSILTYDTVYAAALSIQLSFSTGNYSLSGKQLFTSATLLQFVGLTGFYDLSATGDRITDYQIVNVRPDYVFHQTFQWNTTALLTPIAETFWHDGTTQIPGTSLLPFAFPIFFPSLRVSLTFPFSLFHPSSMRSKKLIFSFFLDLDVKTPFDYWSCDGKESGTDKTGYFSFLKIIHRGNEETNCIRVPLFSSEKQLNWKILTVLMSTLAISTMSVIK